MDGSPIFLISIYYLITLLVYASQRADVLQFWFGVLRHKMYAIIIS